MSIPGIDKLFDRINELEEQYMNLDMQKLEVTAERDKYKAGLDDAMHLLMNHNHHADPEWVSGYDDLCNRYSKIKEG